MTKRTTPLPPAYTPLSREEATAWLQARLVSYAERTRGQHVVWSLTDAAAIRVLLREQRRTDTELEAARAVLASYRQEQRRRTP